MKVGSNFHGYIVVLSDTGVGVTGLVDGNFGKAVSLNGEIVDWSMTITEVDSTDDPGLYSYLIVPEEVGECHIHISHATYGDWRASCDSVAYEEDDDLRLTRRAGAVIADGTEQDMVVIDDPVDGFIVMKGLLKLSNMVAGDRLIIREKYRMGIGEDYMTLDQHVVEGVHADFPALDLSPSMPNRYGFKITIQQTSTGAGGYKTFKFELFCQEKPAEE